MENFVLSDIESKISDSVEIKSQQINKQFMKDVLATKNLENDSANSEPSSTNSAVILSEYNSVEAGIISIVNNIRSSQGLQVLNPNSVLNSIAISRSQDMVDRNYFSHTTPDGKNIANVFSENGIAYTCMGENLGQSSPPSWGSHDVIVDLWMKSSGHKIGRASCRERV